METEQIQKRIAEITKEEQEVKTAKKAIKDQLENDLEYVQARDEAKKANLKKKAIKDQIMQLPENQKLAETIKNNTQDLAVLKDILSAELFDYFQKSKKEEIVDADGQIRKFKIEAKLVAEKSGFGK
ncbi:MAG: hypothetical protein NTY30_02965 [Candidatus Berkelbacteria bacterium]|nr:hypothetical protein [Candidatus Berkelbacteria bacterium]